MSKSRLTVISLLFLILFISPVLATLPVDLNVSETLVQNCRDINCFNSTINNNIYCAVACEGTGGTAHIYRFSSILTSKQDCTISPITDVDSIAWVSLNQVDLTFSASNNLYRFNTTTWTNCSQINYSVNTVKVNNYGLEYYNDGSNSWLYVAEEGKIVIENNGVAIGYTGLGDRDDISLPNSSSNTTLWVTDIATDLFSVIERVTNGVEDGTNVNIYTTYGIGQISAFDIVRVDSSTEWLYLLNDVGSSNYQLYRINLTQVVESGNTVLTANLPSNATIQAEAFNFQSTLTSTLNGTLIYYLDGTNWYNESVTTAPLTNTVFTVSHAEIGTGGHNWSVQYIDSLSNTWNSGTNYFTVQDLGVIPYIAEGITNFFGLEDIDDGLLILAFVISLMISIGVMFKINSNSWQVFVAIFFVSMVIFWKMDFIPTGIIIIIFLGIAGLFIGIVKGVIS